MTTDTPMAHQLTNVALLIGALERGGWTPEMSSFVRSNRDVRRQIIELVTNAMPTKKPAEPMFALEIDKLHVATLQGLITSQLSTWNSDELEPFIAWVISNPAVIVETFGLLSQRNGEILVRSYGIYRGVVPTRASLAREYGLSSTMVKTITDNGYRTITYVLRDKWYAANESPPEPSVRDLQLEKRIVTALRRAGINTPSQLNAESDEDLLHITGIGEKTVDVIRRQLEWYYKNK